jgi:hypothetical protein
MIGKLSFFVGCSLAAWVTLRVLPEIRAHRRVMRDMPPDNLGNYDLDGVSYDPGSHTVVVAADAAAPAPEEHILLVDEVIRLHGT